MAKDSLSAKIKVQPMSLVVPCDTIDDLAAAFEEMRNLDPQLLDDTRLEQIIKGLETASDNVRRTYYAAIQPPQR